MKYLHHSPLILQLHMRWAFIGIVNLCVFAITRAHPWGTDRCGPPEHGNGATSDTTGLTLALNGNTLVLSSTSQFKGFFLQVSNSLSFSDPPSQTTTSSICTTDDLQSVLMHTSSVSRTFVSATVACSDFPGRTFSVQAYLVYRYSRQYVFFNRQLTCPTNSGSTAVTTVAPGSATTVDAASGFGQFTSLGMVDLQWVSSIQVVSGGASMYTSTLTAYFDTNGYSVGWVGIGFGYTDFKMDGGKKAVVLSVNNGQCSISFQSLVNHQALRVISGTNTADPWSISPRCNMMTSTLGSMTFKIGAQTLIALPPQGTSMYVLIAGERGYQLGAHGMNWDYKMVDFLSTDSPDGSGEPVNPNYMAHGILMIIVFCIFMPLTAFLILVDKKRYRHFHKWFGLFILLLMVVGWLLTNPAKDKQNRGTYASLSSSDDGLNHSQFGSAAAWITVAVCVLGVLMWVIRLPKTMKATVRYLHGIVGVFLSFFGPITVWKGWVRLKPVIPIKGGLTNSPIVWLILTIILAVAYAAVFLGRLSGGGGSRGGKVHKRKEAVLTQFEIAQFIQAGRLILIVNGVVVEIPDTFAHPGGYEVMAHYNGQEIGPILAGSQPASINGRLKFVAHSDAALSRVQRMRIGVLAGGFSDVSEALAADGGAVAPAVTELYGSASAPIQDEHYTSLGQLVSQDRLNAAEDFPVRLFRIGLNFMRDLGDVEVGSRIYLSLPENESSAGQSEAPAGDAAHSVPAADEESPATIAINVVAKKELLKRPYTVIHVGEGTVDFAIKIYPNGQFTQRLNFLQLGDAIQLSRAMAHPPIPTIPAPPSMLVFVAGGTGITPMIGYMAHIAEAALGGILLWWVKHEKDLFLVEELKAYMRHYNLKVQLFYTQVVDKPKEITVGTGVLRENLKRRGSVQTDFDANPIHGRISATSFVQAFHGAFPIHPREMCFIVSGPKGFVETAQGSIKELGVPDFRLVALD